MLNFLFIIVMELVSVTIPDIDSASYGWTELFC